MDFWELLIRAHACLGHLYYDIGEYENSKLHYSKAISIGERAEKAPSEITSYKAGVARAEVIRGEKDIDLKSLREKAAETKLKLYKGQTQRFLGQILLHLGDQHLAETEDWLKKAIAADKQNGMPWHLAVDYASLADVYKRMGNKSRAKNKLSAAIEIFKACSADGWVERYKSEMKLIEG